MVRKIGVEPTTPRIQGEYATIASLPEIMAGIEGLEPSTSSLTARHTTIVLYANMEPRLGIEPRTSCLQNRCSSQLSYQGNGGR